MFLTDFICHIKERKKKFSSIYGFVLLPFCSPDKMAANKLCKLGNFWHFSNILVYGVIYIHTRYEFSTICRKLDFRACLAVICQTTEYESHGKFQGIIVFVTKTYNCMRSVLVRL